MEILIQLAVLTLIYEIITLVEAIKHYIDRR